MASDFFSDIQEFYKDNMQWKLGFLHCHLSFSLIPKFKAPEIKMASVI